MILDNLNIFSTQLKIFEFQNSEIQPLINEIIEKKSKIKQVSKFFSNYGGIGKYYSDYRNPVKLHEYEKLIFMVGNLFSNQGKHFEMINYWSAFYYENSIHNTHLHGNSIIKENHNYSSVLYLTDNGGTTFFSSNSTTEELEVFVKSKVGKLVLFPKMLLHNGLHNEKGERIIISSNIGIYDA